jgi:LacI family transcriptional regulator
VSNVATTKRRPTQGDVAKRADVSQATVSYALSGNSTVALPEETRQRILEAARELGYVPNGAARSLRTRRTMTIACIIPDITNPYYPLLERGVQDVAEAHGYNLIVYNTDGDAEKERRALLSAREGRVDGLIMTPFHLERKTIAEVVDAGVRVVLLGPSTTSWTGYGVDTISGDNGEAARIAVNHLLCLGHTRVAMAAGVKGTPPREYRVEGYRRALAEHHIPIEEQLIRAGQFTEAGGYAATRELLTMKPRPTAIFAANDLMAIGSMYALREVGLSVPDDVSIVGFDNIAMSALVHPALTTIDQFPREEGARAAKRLLSRLEGEDVGPPTYEQFHYALVIRESTRALAASGERRAEAKAV